MSFDSLQRSSFAWTLPPGPPLSAEQRRLVAAALELEPAVVRRVLQVRPWAQHYADDLCSVAREGFIWAAQKFDPARGSQWMSYAFWGARMRCIAWLKASTLRDGDVSLDASVAPGDPAAPSRQERIPDSAPGPEERLLLRQLHAAVARLPDRERLAVQRLLDEKTLTEVSAERGRSREAIRKWEVAAIKLLREEFGIDSRQERRKRPPLDAKERALRALQAAPRSVAELRDLTGYTRMGAHERLRALKAVQVGVVMRNGKPVPLWGLPREVT